MTETEHEETVEPIQITDADIDEAIAACDGDLRGTIKAFLIGQ